MKKKIKTKESICYVASSSKEHIIPPFVKNRGTLSVTRINFGVVGKVEQALNDIGTKLLVVASRKVRAPDAAAEERVAGENPTLDFGIKTDTSHGMARRVDDLKGTLPHFDDFSILQVDIGKVAITHEWQPEHHCLLSRAKEIVFHIGMGSHWDIIAFFHGSIAHDMVDMSVRADDHQRLEIVTVDETKEFILFGHIGAAWVYNNAFLFVVIVNDIGVFSKWIEDKGF